MKTKLKSSECLTASEMGLIEQLREHPELMGRFESILALANTSQGPLKTADEVEELLVQEVRKLGNATMTEWAASAQERVSSEIKAADATVRNHKKKR